MMKSVNMAICGSLMLFTAAAATAAEPAAPKLTADAAAALTAMGTYLRNLDSFTVDVDATTEDVLAGGQKLQFGNKVAYAVNRPDQLSAEIASDKVKRHYNFDGTTLTVENVRDGFYAQLPVRGNIGTLLDKAYEVAGVEFPLQDLFRWGDPSSNVVQPTEGFLVGIETIGANKTRHFAFRQKGVDYQIWLDDSASPVPRKLVITNLGDPAQPQYVANLSWNLKPDFAADRFAFKPRPGATAIKFLPATTAAAAK